MLNYFVNLNIKNHPGLNNSIYIGRFPAELFLVQYFFLKRGSTNLKSQIIISKKLKILAPQKTPRVPPKIGKKNL